VNEASAITDESVSRHDASACCRFPCVLAGKAHPHDEPGKALIRALDAHLRELQPM
jgi:glucan phosphorylase